MNKEKIIEKLKEEIENVKADALATRKRLMDVKMCGDEHAIMGYDIGIYGGLKRAIRIIEGERE